MWTVSSWICHRLYCYLVTYSILSTPVILSNGFPLLQTSWSLMITIDSPQTGICCLKGTGLIGRGCHLVLVVLSWISLCWLTYLRAHSSHKQSNSCDSSHNTSSSTQALKSLEFHCFLFGYMTASWLCLCISRGILWSLWYHSSHDDWLWPLLWCVVCIVIEASSWSPKNAILEPL